LFGKESRYCGISKEDLQLHLDLFFNFVEGSTQKTLIQLGTLW